MLRGQPALLEFVNALLKGELPLVPALLESTLLPLRKPDGNIRPVAIGEVWF
jgi:hypothetical protein